VSLFSVSSSTGSRLQSSTQINGISQTHGSSLEYKEDLPCHSPTVSMDMSLNDCIEECSQSNDFRTRMLTQRKTLYIPRLQEFNIYFDKNDLSELEVKRDIHAQLSVQVSFLNNLKLSQLTNEIYEVILDMQKKRVSYRWWTDSQGRDWRISCRSTTKKDT
jgi:hypothetical protein